MKRLIALCAAALVSLSLIPATDARASATSNETLKRESRGDTVILVQSRLRDLGYYNYKITGQYGGVTEDAMQAFQKANGLDPDGMCGEETLQALFSNNAKRTLYNARKPEITPTPTPSPTPKPTKTPTKTKAPTKTKESSKDAKDSKDAKETKGSSKATPKPTSKPTKAPSKTSSSNSSDSSSSPKYGKYLEWKTVSGMVGRGDSFTIKDFNTGTTLRMTVVGGHNHLDVEPSTASDTAKFKRMYGGKWSWDRRAILCRIDGQWIAASVNGMPHGYETISGNDMKGQVCIHFLNSRTHGSSAKDPDHQAMIRKAAGK